MLNLVSGPSETARVSNLYSRNKGQMHSAATIEEPRAFVFYEDRRLLT